MYNEDEKSVDKSSKCSWNRICFKYKRIIFDELCMGQLIILELGLRKEAKKLIDISLNRFIILFIR
ncbi:hypothetical protein ABE042_05840 [Viridibacillus arvi]|uniref:hypothetical protein n=1 Tax=Viridibacillus arvi TaxID=263475 RepID=UPI003D2897C1